MINLDRYWYSKRPSWLLLLLPLEYFFKLLVKFNKQRLLKQQYKTSCPLIVVGNISVGGTGKSPLTIALITLFQEQGYKVGVVSRGYGSKRTDFPYRVKATDCGTEAADEPLMIVQSTAVDLVIDPDRVRACQYLLKHHSCDLIISDDGLQHYKMGRDIEIAVIDGSRGLGNGHCLPVGPLREPQERLEGVDYVVVNTDHHLSNNSYTKMSIEPQGWYRVRDNQYLSLQAFAALQTLQGGKVHAIAGIGNPDRFYKTLASLNVQAYPHNFADHQHYSTADFEFIDTERGDMLCMTEKDAVKCKHIAPDNSYYLKVAAKLETQFIDDLTKNLEDEIKKRASMATKIPLN